MHKVLFTTLTFALLLGAAAAADRVTADAYLVNVPSLLKEEKYSTIEDMSKRALQADDTCPNAHYYLGVVYEKSGNVRGAFKCFQTAATNASKEKDTVLATKAAAAAKRIGMGLMELETLDTKLADRLQKVADDAYDAKQLETAKQAYSALVVLLPNSAKAKEGLEKVTAALTERGDPIKSKVASAMLSEMWYKLGIGKKTEAKQQAKDLSTQFAETEYGKEASDLLARDFSAPDKEEVKQLAKKYTASTVKAVATKPATPSTSDSSAPSTAKVTAPASAPNNAVDVTSVEHNADEETKKMAKSALVPAFTDAYKKGKAHYQSATPGSDGNQVHVAAALESFIKAESIYQRIETENLVNDEVAAMSKEASMLRYGCMKMTILVDH